MVNLPIASFGLIGSSMALLGIFMPRVARKMVEEQTPVRNFLVVSGLVLIGLMGLSMAIPYWGILPATLLYASMHLMGFFVSTYLNRAAPSEQRATVLSFKGLCTNFAYAAGSMMFSALIASIKEGTEPSNYVSEAAYRKAVFVESLGWFPGYFLVTLLLVAAFQCIRFGKRSTVQQQ